MGKKNISNKNKLNTYLYLGSVDLLDELKSIYHDLDALNAISTDDVDGIARSLDFEDPDTVLTTTSGRQIER